MCSYLNTSLGLHSALQAAGVGDENASILTSTLAWIQKDGASMLASIAFAYFHGSYLDSNSKQWRLFADVANDFGFVLQILSPMLPLPLSITMCLIGITFSLVGTAGVATRMALVSHQAQRGNLADVRAKDGSQEMLVNLVALGLSVLLLSFVTDSIKYKIITASVLIFFHVYANYKAVRAVRIKTLNRPRLLILLHKWFTSTKILSVEEANKNEPLVTGAAYLPTYFPYGYSLKIGCSLTQALNSMGKAEASHQFKYLHQTFRYDNYMLLGDFQKKKMFLIYHENITPEEELEGFFVAYLCVLHFITMEKNIQFAMVDTTGMKLSTPSGDIISKVKCGSHALYQDFKEAAKEEGWKVDPLLLAPDEWRYSLT
ncbi:RUS family member 1-like isoform X2 [Oratosquilla oratoria]